MNLLDIPEEVLVLILRNCTKRDLVDVHRTCRLFKRLTRYAYHDYYLYSLEYLTRETPLDKRIFALLARKSCKAGLLTLEDLEYYEQKLAPVIEKERSEFEDRTVYMDDCVEDDPLPLLSPTEEVFQELRMRLTQNFNLTIEKELDEYYQVPTAAKGHHYRCKHTNSRCRDYRDYREPDAYTSDGLELIIAKNKHDLLLDYVTHHAANELIRNLTYKSDARTTAIVLAQMCPNSLEKYLGAFLIVLAGFIWVDNDESFIVVIKYLYPRLDSITFLSVVGMCIYDIAYKDAVECFLAITKHCEGKEFLYSRTQSSISGYAHVFNSLGIIGFSKPANSFQKLCFQFMAKFYVPKSPF